MKVAKTAVQLEETRAVNLVDRRVGKTADRMGPTSVGYLVVS